MSKENVRGYRHVHDNVEGVRSEECAKMITKGIVGPWHVQGVMWAPLVPPNASIHLPFPFSCYSALSLNPLFINTISLHYYSTHQI